MKEFFIVAVIIVGVFIVGYWWGFGLAEASAEFEIEVWRQQSLSWQYAAEQYGGICKWLLEGKPIYGSIVMDANSILSDCLIVSGGEYAIEMTGTNCLIKDNHFVMADMDWIDSLNAVDPNDYYINLEGIPDFTIENCTSVDIDPNKPIKIL